MDRAVIGILAHVDAGKTTLAEALMYKAGKLRKLGRVDHKDSLMDSHALEKERGVTIFSSQAVFTHNDLEVFLLDTPGHVDFSPEAERTAQVLDYAILVISGIDGVQAHTQTLWKMLESFMIPVLIFVTKMDFARKSREELTEELKKELSSGCVDFSLDIDSGEELATCGDEALEEYINTGKVSEETVKKMVAKREVFPCFFGSGLKLEGIDEFLDGIEKTVIPKSYPDQFSAKVFKISYDDQGNRLTHLKITGGVLKVKDTLDVSGKEEKVNQIRVYTGAKYESPDTVSAGGICAVTGLSSSVNGQSLGADKSGSRNHFEPVMSYRIKLPDSVDSQLAYRKLMQFEEQDPSLSLSWDSSTRQIRVGLMGKFQAEILKALIKEKLDMDVEIDSGKVLYKETISDVTEGVGHYEPLRHYAEVHLILEPLERGSGIVIDSSCSEDLLERSWQRLILTHIAEKQHLGVLTGSPITDIKITLASGRAHLKHTEGGDFRQATYRAIRQGLMQARSVLLEPYYSFRLEIPSENLGTAINDIRLKSGTFDIPQTLCDRVVITGRAPVTEFNDYASIVASYTSGRGSLSLVFDGYDLCHNAQKVLDECRYDPESDLDNTPDSVFCAHGGGFTVKWNKVFDYMHLEKSLLAKEKPYETQIIRQNIHIDDKELEQIMEREFGPIKRPVYSAPEYAGGHFARLDGADPKQLIIIDGYNVVFAWDELKELYEKDMDVARQALVNIVSNYAAFVKTDAVLVFDAYRVPGNTGKRYIDNNVRVVYTKERETGDAYIEKLLSQIGKNERVKVVTSDNMIRLAAMRTGAIPMSQQEFREQIKKAKIELDKILQSTGRSRLGTIGENLKNVIDTKIPPDKAPAE